MGMVKQDMGASRIAMMQKELRGTIKQLNDEKILLDKQGLILAGADRAIREMLTIFRDDPIEGPPRGINGCLDKDLPRRILRK